MKRAFVASWIGWSIAVGAVALAAPARLPYEPAPAAPSAMSLVGTTWVGPDTVHGGDWTAVFEPGGILYYSYVNGTYRNATWKQEGDVLYFEINKGFCENKCIIRGDVIEGDSWNIKGTRWKTYLTRVR